MKRFAVFLMGGCLVAFGGALASHGWACNFQSPASAVKPTIYVSDFELDVAPPSTASQNGAAASQRTGKALTPEQEKRKHANELVNWMSTSLVTELQKAGYSVSRLHGSEGRPSGGAGIRGLFAEIDKENHWRRALLRAADDSGKMQAVVSVANLAKPAQAMYEIAPLPGNEAKPGAVITLSPYVPLTKYEVDKQADQAALQVVAARIVKDLTALLAANPAAFTP